MADFVAVIRRAVDGLADNTPEMRARVYEKARSAVTRQLESMKPRPPEEMLRRQFDKLEIAIAEVENEHAEALPPLEEQVAEQPAEAVAETEWQAAPEPEAAHAPAVTEEIGTAEDEPAGYDAPQAPYEDEQAEYPAEARASYPDAPQTETAEDYAPEQHHADWQEQEPAPEPTVEDRPWLPHHDTSSDEHVVVPEDIAPTWFKPVEQEDASAAEAPAAAPERETAAADEGHAGDAHTHHDDPSVPAWAGPDDHAFPDYPSESKVEPVAASSVAEPEPSVAPAGEPFNESATVSDFDHYIGEDLRSPTEGAGAEPKMPAAPDDLSWDPSPFDDVSLDAPQPSKSGAAGESEQDKDVVPFPAPQSGQGRRAAGAKAKGDARPAVSAKDILDMDAVVAARRPAKTIRTAPRRRINYTTVALGLLGLVVLGGGGYAAWSNKETLSDMIGDLVSSPPAAVPTEDTTPPAPDEAGGATTPAPATETAAATPGEATDDAAGAAPAPAGDGSVADKFTERLLADGTEVNEGAGEQVASATSAEGKSIAEQNVAAKDTPAAEAGEAPAVNPAAAAVSDDKALPAPGAQKMFLYEERLGQSVPTAIEGTVTWSIKREPGQNGIEEPTVQGQIVVPDRGLSALLTFRRNTDPSLPASHLVEIVFSLPPTFEGGSVESVQRIALKQTEQDRGNALIAVPAKITDDFHMIALNDFPDAMKTNLDLLKNRDWIDIPVTYRNGRRALLTMDKGKAGKDAFDTALREWAALGTTANNSQ